MSFYGFYKWMHLAHLFGLSICMCFESLNMLAFFAVFSVLWSLMAVWEYEREV